MASRERLGKVRAVNDPHLGSLVTCRWSRPARCSRDLAVAVICLATLLSSPAVRAQALWLVVIGDSLSAEYDSITGVPGVDDPTEYGAISVPGYESMSWVEVLGRLCGSQINLGTFDSNRLGWGCLRFAGYEFNFAVPGFTAGQFEQVVNSSFLTDPQLFLYRQQLAGVLQGQGDAAVIWLGANEFRANYGFLYAGNSPPPLINQLVNELGAVIAFVPAQKPAIKLVIANLPDLGATPTKQADHPDVLKRANATAATVAAGKGIPRGLTSRGAGGAVTAGALNEPAGRSVSFSFAQIHVLTDRLICP